jgi:hypothetical protein
MTNNDLTKHTHKTIDRVTNPTKNGGKLRCSEREQFLENITLRMKLDSNMRPQSIKFDNEFPNLVK